jgi:hypothetical protein
MGHLPSLFDIFPARAFGLCRGSARGLIRASPESAFLIGNFRIGVGDRRRCVQLRFKAPDVSQFSVNEAA